MMTKDKINIDDIKNPDIFKVPEGYFDNLTDKIMANIPAEETKVISINEGKKSNSWFKRTSIAACATIAIIGASALLYNNTSIFNNGSNELIAANEDTEYQDDILEYSMLDENDVYSYLAGESY